MSIPQFVDGETDLDSITFNRIVNRVNAITDGTAPIALPGIEGALGEQDAARGRITPDISTLADDNIPAINQALQELKAMGGGEITLPTHKQFAIRPSATNRILIPDNCRLNLGDARLRVASDSPAYSYLISGEGGPSAAASNIAITGGEIDQNPANHALADAWVNGALAVLSYNAQNFLCDGVTFISGGVNTVVVNGPNCRNVRVNGNTITFMQAPSSTPDYDNSAIYLEALGIEANHNRFYSEHSESARACIELHGPLAAAIGNQSWNYWTIANLVSSSADLDADVESYGVTCDDNIGYGLRHGITLWPRNGTIYRQVGIANNKLYLAQKSGNWQNCHGISFVTSQNVDGIVDGLDISHNLIEFESGDARTVDADGLALNYSSTAALATAQHSILRNAQVAHNTIVNAPLYGIKVGNTLFAGAEHENVLIESNLQVDSGCNRAMHRDQRVPLLFAGKFTNTWVRNNPVIVTNADGTSADQRWLWVVSSATSGGGNVLQDNPVLVNSGHTLPETTKEAVFPMRRVAAATTLGTVTGKQEVFDQYGASQGFVPIYDAIS